MSRTALVLASLVAASLPSVASADQILVSTDGWNNTPNLAQAIYMAADGDELVLLPGTYEAVTIADRTLTLTGYGELTEVKLRGLSVIGASGNVLAQNILFTDQTSPVSADEAHLTLQDVRFEPAQGGSAGSVLSASNDATVVLFGSEIHDFESDDALVSIDASTFYVTSSRIRNNATLAASPVHAVDSIVDMWDAEFSGNSSEAAGGALSVEGGSLVLTSCDFTDSYSASVGGHVFASGADEVTIEASNFTAGAAEVAGGALHLNGVDFAWIAASGLVENDAPTGGALLVTGKSALVVVDSMLARNAAYLGGHAAVDTGRIDLVRSWMTEGSAEMGSAVALIDGLARVQNSGVMMNASSASGPLYQLGGRFEVNYSTIADNQSAGAALSVQGGKAYVVGSIFSERVGSLSIENAGAVEIRTAFSIMDAMSLEEAFSGAILKGPGTVNAMPMFMDRAAGLYMLSLVSPALDAAPCRSGATDLDGTTCDMGMFGGPLAMALPDADNDGFVMGRDCNDGDAAINESAEEIESDGIDNDCDGVELVADPNPF